MSSNFYLFWIIYMAIDGLCAIFEKGRGKKPTWASYWFSWVVIIFICAVSYWGEVR